MQLCGGVVEEAPPTALTQTRVARQLTDCILLQLTALFKQKANLQFIYRRLYNLQFTNTTVTVSL